MAVADAFGRVYIADKESHAVLRISADGTTIETVAGTHNQGDGPDDEQPATSVALSNPNGLFTLADGTTYILDLDNHKIRRFDARSRSLRTIIDDPAGFGAGRGLWVSPDESLVYYNGAPAAGANQNVRRFTPDGGIETAIALPGDLGNLTVDPAGHLVVTSRARDRVFRVAADFNSYTTIAGDRSTGPTPSGQPATTLTLTYPPTHNTPFIVQSSHDLTQGSWTTVTTTSIRSIDRTYSPPEGAAPTRSPRRPDFSSSGEKSGLDRRLGRQG